MQQGTELNDDSFRKCLQAHVAIFITGALEITHAMRQAHSTVVSTFVHTEPLVDAPFTPNHDTVTCYPLTC